MFYVHFISYYDIYWTSLLTRWHSASFCLLCLFIAEKVQKWKCSEKSGKITEIIKGQKTPGARRGVGVVPRGGHTHPRRGPGHAAPGHGGPTPCTALRRLFRLYILSDTKTLKQSASVHEMFCSAATIADKIRGTESLCSGTLPGRGIDPGAISIDSTAISIAAADSHDEEGVVLPRGWGPYR